MNKLKQLAVGKQVLLMFGMLCAILGLIGALLLFTMRSIERSNRERLAYVLYESELIAASAQNIGLMQAAIFRHVLSSSVEEKKRHDQFIREVDRGNVEQTAAYEKFVDTEEERQLYDRVLQARKEYMEATKLLLVLSLANKNAEANEFLFSTQVVAYEKYQVTAKNMSVYVRTEVQDIVAVMDARTARSRQVGDVFIILAILIAGGTGLKVTGIARRLKEDNRALQIEIEERKRAEETSRLAEEKYRSIFENTSEGIFQNALDGAFISANPALARILGYDTPEQLVRDRTDIQRQGYVDAGQREEFKQILAEHGAVKDFEYQVQRKDGSRIWVSESAHLVRGADAQPLYYEGSVQDITERKQSEAALKQSEKRYRSLFEANPLPMWIYDLETLSFLEVNDAAISHYCYEREEFLSMTIADIRPAADKQALLANVAHVADRVVDHAGVWKHQKKDGSLIDVEITSHVLDHSERRAELVLAFDVTERQRTEAERQVISEIVQGVSTTTNLDELLDLARNSIGKLLYAENCFVALHDKTTDLIHFEFWVDKFDPVPPPQPVGEGFCRSSYVLRTGRPLLLTKELKTDLFEQEAVSQSGSDSASWMGVPLRTPTRTIGVLAVQHYEKDDAYSQRDLEFFSLVGDQIGLAIERKQAEVERERSQQFQRALLDGIGHGIHGIDKSGNIIFENPAGAEMLGWKPNELIGRTAHPMMHYAHGDGSAYPVEDCPIHATLRDGALRRASDETFWRRDGTSFPVEFTVAPIRAEFDDIAGAVVVFADVTERKKAETELRLAKEIAEAANRAKGEFLANMSHEIRTPMNGVIGMTGLLMDTPLNQEQREFARTIQTSGEALLSIINDILDFSKIEANKLELEVVNLDLAHVLRGTVSLLQTQAKAKGLELSASIDPGVPTRLRG
ncbi:MAG: hypothetical protein DLM73_12445, partial [Chthoniobacterales bacterium]